MPKDTSLDQMIGKLQRDLSNGNDAAARNLITAGLFIVTSDLAFRLATMKTKIDIDLPDFSVGNLFKKLNPLHMSPSGFSLGGIDFDLPQLDRDPLGDIMSIFSLKDFNVDIEIETEGLWDFKYTCFGIGFVAAGIGLMGANHPEWISEAIDRAQKLVEKAEETMIKVMEANAKNANGMDAGGLASVAASVTPLLLAAGGATAIPGIPPPP